jgi:hypothetical protein
MPYIHSSCTEEYGYVYCKGNRTVIFSKFALHFLQIFLNSSDGHCWIVNYPASYLHGPRFNSRFGGLLSRQEVFPSSSTASPEKYKEQRFTTGDDCFLHIRRHLWFATASNLTAHNVRRWDGIDIYDKVNSIRRWNSWVNKPNVGITYGLLIECLVVQPCIHLATLIDLKDNRC